MRKIRPIFDRIEISLASGLSSVVSLRDDIVDGERLDEISVTILEAKLHPNSSLAWLLLVADDAGNEFTVKIWHTHNVDTWWREGWRYVLKEGRGTHRRGSKILLHSTGDFTVHRPDGVVDLLAVGDSHIGRETRPKDTGSPHRTVRQFIAAMGSAARYDVNAVLYAGDLFDDNPTAEDRTIAESGFDILRQNDIPFYFIYGNHGVDIAKDLYDGIRTIEISQLDTEGIRLSDSVELFGVDNSTKEEFIATTSDFSTFADVNHRILVVHNEIDPPREDGIPMESLHTSVETGFDYILAGHLHDPESDTASSTQVQYLGSTADISTKQNATDNSAWLIRITPEIVDLNRLELC